MRIVGLSPNVDWIAVSFRWVFIISTSLWMIWNNYQDPLLLVLLIALTLINLAATFFQAVSSMPNSVRIGFLVLDLVFAQLVFFIGMTPVSLAWVGLLPVLTTALYYGWVGAALAAMVNALIQVGLFLVGRTPEEGGLFLLASLLINLLLGLPLGYYSRRLFSNGSGPRKGRGRLAENGDQRDQERRRTIFDMISALNASLNYQRVLETSVELSAETLDHLNAPDVSKLVSAVLLFTQDDPRSPELEVASSRNLFPSDRDLRLPGVSGLLAHTIDEGEPSLSRSVNTDPELSRIGALGPCRSAYCLPLRSGLDAYGILLFAHPAPDFFTADRREVLDIVARQSIIAIQNARLYRDLELEKNRMVEIQEEGRKKLARDLHDGPTQSISAIAMRVNFARRLMDRDMKAAAEELYKIEDLARRTTKEIRHMLFTLRPLVLESQGLVAALESMAEKMRETFSQNVIIQADAQALEALETNKQAVVFYIAEEAVNNARKHAKAEHIWVRLKMLRDGLSLLEVEDDGVGFDLHAVEGSYETRGSLGMVNLRERTELVSGVLRIDSSKGHGTRVQVVIPLNEEAADRIHRMA